MGCLPINGHKIREYGVFDACIDIRLNIKGHKIGRNGVFDA